MHDQEDIVKRHVLRKVRVCPSCKKSYDPANIRTFGHQGSFWLMFVICHHCCTVKVAAAYQPLPKPRKDLAASILDNILNNPAYQAEVIEAIEAQSRHKTISADDVLDMQKFLESFSGSIDDLLNGEGPDSPAL